MTYITAYRIFTVKGANSALFLQGEQREVSCQVWLFPSEGAGGLDCVTWFLPVAWGIEWS